MHDTVVATLRSVGAALVSAADEEARVLPVIAALAAEAAASPMDDPLRRVSVSVDTFYASVARAAVAAGAAIINDVSGGVLDPLMLDTAAELGVPAILMHMRGTPRSMALLAAYGETRAPGPDSAPASAEALQIAEEAGVVSAVVAELSERCRAAQSAGMFSWNIILDPGLGFAKAPVHSYALMRQSLRTGDWLSMYWPACLPAGTTTRIAAALPASSALTLPFPLLFGPSRKGFIVAACVGDGRVGGGPAAGPGRDWGSAAAVTACVLRGADFVRVHNPEAMRDVVAVADAIHRGFSAGVQ